jgi:hypothetical protein
LKLEIYVVRYTYALQALSHALLLSPQNPFTVLQFAETAYSSGDVPLALKMFLVVIDMSEEEADAIPLGISIRAWWGIKLVRGLESWKFKNINPHSSFLVRTSACLFDFIPQLAVENANPQEHQTH